MEGRFQGGLERSDRGSGERMSGVGYASKLVDPLVPQNQGQGQLKDGKENTLCPWSETKGWETSLGAGGVVIVENQNLPELGQGAGTWEVAGK